MATRKYYRTVFTVTVLSTESLPVGVGLSGLAYGITEGDWSGDIDRQPEQELTGAEIADALLVQGSDPEFLGLDREGNEHDI